MRNDVCSCEVGSVRRPPIARLFSLGAACGVQVQMVELCCEMMKKGLEKNGEARGGRPAPTGPRQREHESIRQKTACDSEQNIGCYHGDLAIQW